MSDMPRSAHQPENGASDLDGGLIPVESFDDVPDFKTEAEEQEFWSTHCFGEGLLAQMEPVPLEGDEWFPPARAKTITRPTRK